MAVGVAAKACTFGFMSIGEETAHGILLTSGVDMLETVEVWGTFETMPGEEFTIVPA